MNLRGRPKKEREAQLNTRFAVSLRPADAAAIARLADRRGLSTSGFIRSVLLDVIRKDGHTTPTKSYE